MNYIYLYISLVTTFLHKKCEFWVLRPLYKVISKFFFLLEINWKLLILLASILLTLRTQGFNFSFALPHLISYGSPEPYQFFLFLLQTSALPQLSPFVVNFQLGPAFSLTLVKSFIVSTVILKESRSNQATHSWGFEKNPQESTRSLPCFSSTIFPLNSFFC